MKMLPENSHILAHSEQPDIDIRLAQLDDMRTAVLRTTKLEPALDILAQISGLEEAVRLHRDASYREHFAVASLKLEAQRHIGAMLADLPRRPGNRSDLT